MLTSIEDYRVELDCYAGPLDLLLFLVRRHEIDLNDIPIARLTEQYLAHVRLLQKLDVNLVGDFLVMAATLLEIKSQMLLPQQVEADPDQSASGQAEANPLDPRYELVQQLLAYKRFKDAAASLDRRRGDWEARFPNLPPRLDPPKINPETGEIEDDDSRFIEIDLEDAHVLDLCEAFSRILDTIGQTTDHRVVYDDTPLALHADDILDRLQRDGVQGSMTLQEIFVGRTSRAEMIGLFLATLELVRQRRVRVIQDRMGGEIRMELAPSGAGEVIDDKAADWRDPSTGQMQYEWPSEEAHKAAERRLKLRASFAAKRAQMGAAGGTPGDGTGAAAPNVDDAPIAIDEETVEKAGVDSSVE